ncbi:unnamed protein product [Meganyctiphanes norvegica]|uniref:Uncharacterized protein n=1 Tax=Meganyctiphanes norvegica TaxID=48144 RepID=A0AAV2Q5Y7_MEGNR
MARIALLLINLTLLLLGTANVVIGSPPAAEENDKTFAQALLNVVTRRNVRLDINGLMDGIFADLRSSIPEQGLDPLDLPEDSDIFELTLFNTTLNGTVFVGDGHVSGLATIHRAGDMTANQTGLTHLHVGGKVGLIDLEASYQLALDFSILGHKLGLTIKLTFVELDFEFDVEELPNPSIVAVRRCAITDFGPIHFHETGAGVLDNGLYNLVANALLNELTSQVTLVIQGAVCTLLEQAINP